MAQEETKKEISKNLDNPIVNATKKTDLSLAIKSSSEKSWSKNSYSGTSPNIVAAKAP